MIRNDVDSYLDDNNVKKVADFILLLNNLGNANIADVLKYYIYQISAVTIEFGM